LELSSWLSHCDGLCAGFLNPFGSLQNWQEDEDSTMAADTGSEWDGKDLISTKRASLKRKMAKQLRFLSSFVS
jgi:hypothetical protein